MGKNTRDSKSQNVESITNRDVDFAKWYTDIVTKAELVDYSSVRGCLALLPYGYAIWENIQRTFDGWLKETGHENVYLPMFIPESLLQKEKDHVEGFAPEVAWVTHGGSEELTERLCVRPTSETLFCDMYSHIIHSYRDLPKLFNQWCSVVRWEKATRPFLRTVEFLWQEGHTAHESEEEAETETIRILNLYAELCENVLAMPVVKGKKSEKERFAGAMTTYSVEAMMHDGKALQSGTSHNFGDGFARAFDIQYTDRNNQLQYIYQTSWGISTRLIGGIIMTHGDDNGLVLPPLIAPVQVVIVPISQHKEGVLDAAASLLSRIKPFCRVKLDDSDKSPGWKFSEHEMKGIPIRLEVGPKDIENQQVVLVRRDTGEKKAVPADDIEREIPALLEEIQGNLYAKARANRDAKTFSAKTLSEFEDVLEKHTGFIKAMWCGERACEDVIKEKTGATSRCMPFEQEAISDVCVCCGKPATIMALWGKAY
jgi:prolyl-tRNA synthetase